MEKQQKKPQFKGGNRFGKRPGDRRTQGQSKANGFRRPSDDTPRIVALNALSEVSQKGAYCQLALDKCLRASHISPEDKRLATRIFYSAAENRELLNYILYQFIDQYPDPYIADVLQIAAAQLLIMDKMPDHAVVDQAVRHAKMKGHERYSGLVNGVLRSLLRARDAGEIKYPDPDGDPIRYASVMYSVPFDLMKALTEALGLEEAVRLAAWKPSVHAEAVRPNFMQMTAAEFEQYAERMNWEYTASRIPGALMVKHAGDLLSHPDFRHGLYSLQSEGSMLAAMAVQAKRGMTVIDCCAAPGGKTCFLAEKMEGTGRVYAWDVHQHRVELIRSQAERLRLYNVRPSERDASRLYEDMELSADAVLADVPCSGLGEMINKPDIKYHVTSESIASVAEVQKKILQTVCRYVRVGGLLVYSTCTIMPQENADQISAFLAEHPEFEPDTSTDWAPEAFRSAIHDGCLQLMPHIDETEGFFVARLRRKRR